MSKIDILIELFGTLKYNVFPPVSSVFDNSISVILIWLHTTLMNNASLTVKSCVQHVQKGFWSNQHVEKRYFYQIIGHVDVQCTSTCFKSDRQFDKWYFGMITYYIDEQCISNF